MTANFSAAYNRSPAWKWNRAQEIVNEDGIPATASWDTAKGAQWIERLTGYIRSYERESDPIRNHELIILYGDIYNAHSIFTDTGSLFRQELEAMILARVTPEELALKIDVPVTTILAYEESFFDVRSKLESAESYILHYVIGPEIQNLRHDSFGPLWKLFGYYQGPEVLRALVSRTVNPQFCMTPDAVGARLNEDISGSFKLACAVAAKRKGGGSMGDKQLLQLFNKVMEVDKMADLSSGSSRGQIADHISAMLSTMALTVGGTSSPTPASDPSVSGEPQFHEFVEMTLHGESDTFKEAQNFEFPKPKPRGETPKEV